jgi:O-antigen/teichoic acid export membrane protein
MTNYVSMAVRLVQGILVTRWLIATLGQEYYGLWVLLWSFFCYSLLLDFGFGVAAQKCTSTELYRQDIGRYNRTVSTIFAFHGAMAIIILLGTVIAAYFVPFLLHVQDASPEELAYIRTCFLCFGVGSALVFPFGMFQEILVGLQKLYLRNYISISSKLFELVGVLIIFLSGGGLITLILFTVILTAVTQFSMLFFIKRYIPGFKLRIRPDRELFRDLFQFSGFVYLTSMARLAWARSGALLVSIFCGLTATGAYQIGGRLPALVSQLTGPYQENVGPIVALLHSREKYRKLGSILINSMRWNSFLATGMSAGVMIYASELIRFLFKIEGAEITDICRVMTISLWFGVVYRTIPEKYFLMAEMHRFLSWLMILESVLMVLGSIAFLAHNFGAVAVVWCALSVKVVCFVILVLPLLRKNAKIGLFDMCKETMLRPAAAAIPALGVMYLAQKYFSEGSDLRLLLIGGIAGAVVYLVMSYYCIANRGERRRIIKYIKPYIIIINKGVKALWN